MPRDYDTQLLESVAVRRRRLREAVLFGPQRTRRNLDENILKIAIGLCVAAVLCGGTVGWSFLKAQFQKQQKEKTAQSEVAQPDVGTAPVPASWVGAQVRLGMLRDALDGAGVPAGLYVLPGQPRPPAARTSSYYVLTKGKQGFAIGIVEFQQGRIGAEFPTEDEACRFLYGELVVKETPPARLDPAGERQAAQQGAALAADARSKIGPGSGGSATYLLQKGQQVDQFGQESGSVLFPYGLPFAQRGLPATARATVSPRVPAGYLRYRVVKPFQATASVSAPAAGGPGGGVRFTVNQGLFPKPPPLPSVRWLLRSGYLERVAAPSVPQ